MLNYRYDLDRLVDRLQAGGDLEAFLDDLFAFKAARSGSREIEDVLSDPQVTAESKLGWIQRVFDGLFGEPFFQFLLQLARNGDVHAVDLLADRILSAVGARGIETAEVSSVVPLSAEQVQRVRNALLRITGREIYVYNTLSAPLLGGFAVRYGGRTLDMSVRRDLEKLRDEIAVGRGG